jgi:hypothetical protein
MGSNTDLRGLAPTVAADDGVASSGSGWVPVFVPADMAPDVLRSVAAYLQSGAAPTGPSEWTDATDEDREAFFGDMAGIEWQLVAALAGQERPVPVSDLAAVLGVGVGAVAGAIGPINKRAKRQGWVAPIRPTRFVPEGSRSSKRGLLLDPALRAWVLARGDDADVQP